MTEQPCPDCGGWSQHCAGMVFCGRESCPDHVARAERHRQNGIALESLCRWFDGQKEAQQPSEMVNQLVLI